MKSHLNALIKIDPKNHSNYLNLYFPKTTKNLPKIVAGFNNNYKNFITNKISNNNDNFPIKLKKINNNYKAGPLVGILTTRGPRGFKGNRSNYIDLIKMGSKSGILVYVITAESFDKVSLTVDGYFYLPFKKIWIIKKMPLPDVIYNRIPTRNEESKNISKDIIQYIKKVQIPYFNYNYFNKLSLHQWMNSSDKFSRFIPQTTEFSFDALKEMLSSYPMIYLKPNNGKAGTGFIKIKKIKNKYILTYQNSTNNRCWTHNNLNSLSENIFKLINNRKYIIQRGIELKTYQNSPYDLRVLVQKNNIGMWQITGIGVRIAGKNSITTHVPRGGYIVSAEKVFKHSFGNYSKDWEEAIKDISLAITKHIEKSSGNLLGELSLDLGIDKDYNLWFFEANSKPMKFDEPSIRYTSLLRLMQYFEFLSGFTG